MAIDDGTPGVVTFLFSDIERSTQLWEEHPNAMRDALERHDAILRDAIEDHGGRIFKTTGDGACAALATVPDAIGAATTILRTLSSETWGPTGPLSVRIGIHSGHATERDGDYFGPALNRTSRIMAAAHGGQVVMSDTAAEGAREALTDDLQLVDLGAHRLRGLKRPERVHQLEIAGLRSRFPPLQSVDAFPGHVPAPGEIVARTDDELVGRSDELDRLEAAWKRASGGSRHVVLVAGDPGMGKTRLVRELARRVDAEGGSVLYGRCDEETIVPYQPFVEALRPYVAAYPASSLHERLHGLEQDLPRLFPELRGRVQEPPPSVVREPEAERYRLFEGTTALLTGVTATKPALLVLDDLHWADQPTLLLLRHMVRFTSESALLLVVTYREVELPRGHPVVELVEDLKRERFTEHVALSGLSEVESGALLQAQAGHDVSPALLETLHRETDGNPFFLVEFLRGLLETDPHSVSPAGDDRPVDVATLRLPERGREIVARRVRRLPAPVNEVLGLAAVVGFDFEVSLLGRAGERPVADVLEGLDEAKDRGLVEERPGRLGWYSFPHAFVRQAVYEELGSARRAQLHARVGLALEGDPRSAATAATLAQHFTHALPLSDAEKALGYTAAAGHDAVAEFAFEDAVIHFRRALELLEQYAPPDAAQRVELLIDLAGALVLVDETAGVEAALRAVDEARAKGSADQFGRAVIVLVEPVTAVFSDPERVAGLFDEAQRTLGNDHPDLSARLLAIEAFKYSAYQLHGRDGAALAERAVGLARRTEDPLALAEALFARATSLEGSADLAERRALGTELVAIGRAAEGRAATASAYGLRVLAGVHLELADAESVGSTITELSRIGEDLHWLPALVYRTQWRATEALYEGRFEDVRRHWEDMRRFARAYRGVVGMQAQQFFYLAREQGELADVVGTVEQIARSHPKNLHARAMLALAQLDSDDTAAALHTTDALLAEDLRRIEQESAWGAILAALTEVVATDGDPAGAALLHELLTPFTDRLLTAVIGLACVGAADRYLGMLCTTLGRWDDAEAHFERAVALEERIRGHALLPRTRYWQARFLGARGRPGDAQAARAIVGRVVETAERLGMSRLCREAQQLPL